MAERILTPALQDELYKGRQLLSELRDALIRFGATDADQQALAASIAQLDEFFLLVIVGEFNAGKSAFINALAGQRVLQEGVTPTTAEIHLLKYGDTVTSAVGEHGVREISAPVELLRDVHIVDTPGTNAIIREHERLTNEFVPRADLVLFVTSADRPFTETERAFLESIRRSEEHTSELQSQSNLVCRLLLEKKKKHETFVIIDVAMNPTSIIL